MAQFFDLRLHPESMHRYERQTGQRLLTYHSFADIVSNHVSSGIPYNQIGSVEVRQARVNPGLVLHLQFGQQISFGTMHLDLIPWAAQVLSPYVRVG
jgi:hypothetical protein